MRYKFIDLFAGIGGFHTALASFGLDCVFASEIDSFARATYKANYNISDSIFNDDIRKISPNDIPDHDILCAGFPCQPFSQAGKKRGFHDGANSERGNLFFCIADILEAKRPNAFILENVKHLLKHDNGNTFKIIKETLEDLNYSVFVKIVKATDYGIPQHRPRIYIVGFNKDNVNTVNNFEFPAHIPLTKTMSDIWEGDCEREVGFTLRVGGRGSPIDDRRNWDSYRVNGKVVRLSPKEGKRMMGFPDSFIFPVSQAQAMKQLGNSVCVDVIKRIGNTVIEYLNINLKKRNSLMPLSLNKGEWSEFYAFLKLIKDKQVFFGGTSLDVIPKNEFVTITAIRHNDSNIKYFLVEDKLLVKNIEELLNTETEYKVDDMIPDSEVNNLLNDIVTGQGRSFNIQNNVLTLLNIEKFKGNSLSKADINISHEFNNTKYTDDPWGIKSFIGGLPTLLNAGATTNFIYKVNNFNGDIHSINNITTRNKIQDRIYQIINSGGNLEFYCCENQIFQHNLLNVDSCMPQILSSIILKYYMGEGAKIKSLVIDQQQVIRIKDFLKAVLLGMFSSRPWDGNYTSNGTLVIKQDGKLLLYHVIKDSILKDYLFNNTKLDTPSSTRHRFGTLYQEKNGLFFKLNLQIRNI